MARTNPKSHKNQNLHRIERPLPLVAQVEQALRQAIEQSLYPSGQLPTEVELAEQLGVSRETVRRAAEKLEGEGLLVKQRRRGTFIKQHDTPLQLQAPPSTIIGYLQADYAATRGDQEVVTRATSSFMFDGALTEAGRAGFHMLVRSAPPAGIRKAFEEVNAFQPVRGFIFASVAEEKLLRRVGGMGLRAVLLDHDLHVPKLSSVRSDSFQNARSAVEHLVKFGHRHIACAHWCEDDLNRWFAQGYQQGLKDAKLRRRRDWQIPVRLTREGANKAVEQLLQLRPRPTAIVSFHNTFAQYLVDAAEKRSVRVPNDLSVFGGGGEEVFHLTCNQVDWYELGRLAMQVLLRNIGTGDESTPEHHVVPYELKPGKTVARLGQVPPSG